MDLLNGIANLFNRPDQVADSTFNEILDAIGRSEKCRYSGSKLEFPIGVLPCGHLFNADALERGIIRHECPECDSKATLYDRVLEDQTVSEIPLAFRIEEKNKAFIGLEDNYSASVKTTLTPTFVAETKVPVLKSDTDEERMSPIPQGFDNSPLSVKRHPSVRRNVFQKSVSSPKISSPLVKHKSPKVNTHEVNTRKGNTSAAQLKRMNEKEEKFKFVPFDSIRKVEKIHDLDQQIWALVTNVHLIKGSDQLLEQGKYFTATFDVMKHFLPKDLFRIASQLKPENLSDLLSKNQNVGTVLMYAMILFLAIEYLSRFRDFNTKSKYTEFFRAERFQTWINAGHLKTIKLSPTDLEKLFRGH